MNASTVRLCNALYTAGNSEGRGFAPAQLAVMKAEAEA